MSKALHIDSYYKYNQTNDNYSWGSRVEDAIEKQFPGRVYFNGSNVSARHPYPRYIL